ncbi:hypothetical protein EYZ11_001335 [Aspergillus tanneri]|uniref:Uncharacterized protein n=1 Tax=Aspergillus tanneri TaxID=1220188 RepID=A0A4V3UQK2_9EURO|nr:hypothetical protein EYZ11_001335 [Aspergillus tanneri]
MFPDYTNVELCHLHSNFYLCILYGVNFLNIYSYYFLDPRLLQAPKWVLFLEHDCKRYGIVLFCVSNILLYFDLTPKPVTIVGLAIGYFCMVTSLSMVLDSPPGSFIHLRILYNQQALGTSHPSPSSESPQPAPSYASTSFWAYYEAIRSLKPIMEVKGREGRKVLNIVTIINVIFTLLDGGAIATQIDNH